MNQSTVMGNAVASNTAVDVAMTTLTRQWYNSIITGLGLSQDQFQLYQGNGSTPTTSQEMWNIFNVVPPYSINNYFNPAQINSFTGDYQLILNSLIPSDDSAFQNCMGDYYMQWQTYFNANPPATFDAKSITDLFNRWALMNAPGKAGCVTGLTKSFINPVSMAIQAFSAANQQYAWNKTQDMLKSNLAQGESKSFTMNSQTASSDTTHTWASGNTSVFFDLFSFGGGGGYDNITVKATNSGLNIAASFQKVTTFAAGPYAVADPNNPILSKYQAWYNSAVMALAYNTKDNTVWNPQGMSNWNAAFGPNGYLQRLASAIVAVDGIDITMTSNAQYSSSEQTQIQAAAKAGFWPFFTATGKGGYTNTVTFNDQGQFTCKTSCALGNPQILGVLQTPTSSAFGN